MVFQLSDSAFLTDPVPMLAQMRATGAAVRTHVPLMGEVWITTSDAVARTVLKDPGRFAHDPTRAGRRTLTAHFWWLPRLLRPLMHNVLTVDGAEHDRLRSAVDTAFARQSVDAMRPRLTALADDLLARMDPDRPADLVAAYARLLPLAAICDLLGIPVQDHAKVTRWIAPISGPTTAATMFTALPGLWKIIRYFRADFVRVRVHRRPGLIGDLVHATDVRLNDDELLAMVITLFVAGHETTVHLISNAIDALAR
jgi:cytochrome P450